MIQQEAAASKLLTVAEKVPDRFTRIRAVLMSEPVWLCPERALLITEFFKKHDDKKDPMVVRKAKALRYLLTNKTVEIWPDEWIVGNVGTKRKSAIIQPELAVRLYVRGAVVDR